MKRTFESLESRRLAADLEDLALSQVVGVCFGAANVIAQPYEEINQLEIANGSDIDQSGHVDILDVEALLAQHGTENGDFNLDGQFDSADWVAVFSGEIEEFHGYESGEANSLWWQGDADCDFFFDSGDLVYLFQQGNYERAPIV